MKCWKNLRIRIHLIQIALLLTGVCLIVLGLYRQEIKTVLMKAIYICLECIGIG